MEKQPEGNDVKKHSMDRFLQNYPSIYSLVSKIYNKIILMKAIIGKKMFNDPKNLMINIGGGRFYKRYWKVLDFRSQRYRYDKHFIDYNFDLMSRKKLPFKDNSVKLFYSSHTFEHLPDELCAHVLKEMYRCLKKGGGARITVPDIDLAYDAYANRDMNFFDSLGRIRCFSIEEKFLSYFASYLVQKHKVDSKNVKHNFRKMGKIEFLNFYIKQIDPLTQRKFTSNHINWFNYHKLKMLVQQAGFKKVYRSTSQNSRFKEMRGKEFDTRPSWSLFVEAIK